MLRTPPRNVTRNSKKSAPPMRQGCAFVSKSPALFKLKAHFRCRRRKAYGISGFRAFYPPDFQQS